LAAGCQTPEILELRKPLGIPEFCGVKPVV